MALRIEVKLQEQSELGAIDLVASLDRLRTMLEGVDNAQDASVTLRVSVGWTAHSSSSGEGWRQSPAFAAILDSHDWIVPAPADEEAV